MEEFLKSANYGFLILCAWPFFVVGKKILHSIKARRVFSMLVLADVVFLILNLIFKGSFLIEKDQTFPEMLRYAEELTCAFFLWRIGTKSKSQMLVSFAIFFVLLFIDDCWALHEGTGCLMSGTAFATVASHFLSVRSNDVGEMVYFLTEVFFFLTVGAYSYRQEKDLWSRAVARKVAIVMLLGGLIGVGLDMVNQLEVVRRSLIAHHFFGLAQSFSKMLFLSLLPAVCMDLFLQSKQISHQTPETAAVAT
jgi:hypothetical protein